MYAYIIYVHDVFMHVLLLVDRRTYVQGRQKRGHLLLEFGLLLQHLLALLETVVPSPVKDNITGL